MTKRERELLESAIITLRYEMDCIGDIEDINKLKELTDEELITVFEFYFLVTNETGEFVSTFNINGKTIHLDVYDADDYEITFTNGDSVRGNLMDVINGIGDFMENRENNNYD